MSALRGNVLQNSVGFCGSPLNNELFRYLTSFLTFHRSTYRDDVLPSDDIQIVSPTLHHCAALVEVFSAIVRSAHGVLLLVSKLALDYVRAKSHFIERGGG